MLLITVSGIVIRERSVGEQDKFIDIYTDKCGLIEVSVKGAKKITGAGVSATQLFAYSKFCLTKRRDRYYINSVEPVRIFYGLRNDLCKLSLASYFSEVIAYASHDVQGGNAEIMRLFLNCLHYLSDSARSERQLKSIFELRFMTECGMMPAVVGCSECGTYLRDRMYFVISEGTLYCSDCFEPGEHKTAVCITKSVLCAVRHIVFADFDRLFNFKVSDASMDVLGFITEQYIIEHLGRTFKTLDFYHDITK
ncbi:MAG: DNA repair protein RecO [Oscillospiraceae bacterium]|nr:DNA repair protein RecO [Oscillospiraceae bacterium]